MRVLVWSVACDPLTLPSIAGEEVEDLGCGKRLILYEGSQEAGVVDQDVWGVGDEFCGGEHVGSDFGFSGGCHGVVWIQIWVFMI